MQQVHLRINDAATGQPTPVRLRVTDANGVYYAPHGRLTAFPTGMNQDVGGNVSLDGKKWAYTDGACEILLPPGKLRVEIAKGPEYKPIDEEITLIAGKMALRFTMERWSDVRKQGWYSGDTRVHFLTPDAALLEGQAEDVAIVNLLVRETHSRDAVGNSIRSIPHIISFSGQSFAREKAGHGVAVNTYNHGGELGELSLLHCHRVVYPLSLNEPDLAAGWTLADWCDQCHRKKGLVIWRKPYPPPPDSGFREPLADLILGKVDAVEWHDIADYHELWNAELAVPLVGASGKGDNSRALGAVRTYAYLPTGQEFSYSNWIEAVRAGRTFASNSPLLHFMINGAVPGVAFPLPEGDQTLQIRIEAKSWLPFDQIELLWNGTPIADARPTSATSPCEAILETEFRVQQSGWLAARCRGKHVSAHTSGVALRRADAPGWAVPAAVQRLLGELDQLRTQFHQRARVCQLLEEARTALR